MCELLVVAFHARPWDVWEVLVIVGAPLCVGYTLGLLAMFVMTRRKEDNNGDGTD
jgi:Sec-independent protein secretion pathway component TatC